MQRNLKPFLFSIVLVVCVSAVWGMTVLANTTRETPTPEAAVAETKSASVAALYDRLRLDTLQLSKEAFLYAMQGYQSLQEGGELKNDKILTIADFTLPSSKKRLFIIDMETGKLLFNTFVSHGRNSGTDMATRFSNRIDSHQSSLGFYVTGNTYNGKNGYSLKLDGMEGGINDNALARAIVVHGSAYVNEKIASAKGFIGRSFGCPAVPSKLAKAIINTIRNGSCLFIYGNDARYIAMSKFLSRPHSLLPDTMIADTMG